MTTSEIKLDLSIVETDADAERMNELTGRLLRDLRELGTESVERSAGGPVPEGVKGDPFTLGALALVVVPTFLPKLVEFLQSWSLRGEESRKVKLKTPDGLEIEFTPKKRLSADEMAEWAQKLAQVQGKQGSSSE